MSGLAMIYGKPEPDQIKSMFEKIKHRGPEIYNLFSDNRVSMAQNYLTPDLNGNAIGNNDQIPYHLPENPALHICYDGLIGNRQELAAQYSIKEDLFLEEKILLKLYEKYGKEMLNFLDDAIYSFIIYDGTRLFAARDPLGIKTLFYAKSNQSLYLASELKSIITVTDDVFEFLPGHYMEENGELVQFSSLPQKPPAERNDDVKKMTDDIYKIIEQSIHYRLPEQSTLGGLLSGGIDSSVINYMVSNMLKKNNVQTSPMKTFALGVGESEDIKNARIMADFIQSEHHELIVDLEQMLDVLPDVIYYLESFDPSLVRSSVSNYLISAYAAKQGIDVLLSGEGGDEIFCGYMYLKQFPLDQLFLRQMECLKFLHNNASLRLDRMNQCNSIRVVAPLISGKLLDYAMSIPAEYKQKPENGGKTEKWIFRKAFEGLLPDSIVWRIKQEFSQGSGSASVLSRHFDHMITDAELKEAQAAYQIVRSKEELYYFRLFTDHFGAGRAVDTVGQWISL